MRKKTISWLIIGASLMVLGSLLFTAVLAVINWDFTKISTVKYETETYEIIEDFDNISIETVTDDIVFKKSEDGKCKVVFFQDQKIKHTAKTEDKTLIIGETDIRNWYDYIQFFSFDTTKITVYLPKDSYSLLDIRTDTGDVKIPDGFNFSDLKINGSTSDVFLNSSVSSVAEISVSTGDISVADAKFGELKMSVTTGDIILKNIDCDQEISANVTTGYLKFESVCAKTFKSVGTTGDISLKNVVIKEKMSIKRDTGDIKFINSDADEMFIKTSTGDVEGTLLSPKIFITKTETGTVKTPSTTNGGKCEVTTSTGDIKLDITK